MTPPHAPQPRCIEVTSTDDRLPLRERIRIATSPRQPLGPSEVRIGLLAMNILPADILQLHAQYGYQPPLPYTPGHEGVAVVIEVGSAVTDLRAGDRVITQGVFGLWADELVVARPALALVDSQGDTHQQAMMSANPATAWVLLNHQVDIKPGQWVIQNAANSAVGQCVRQVAQHLGIALINVVRRADAVPQHHAEHWIVDNGTDPQALRHRVEAITQGATVALALDAIGGQASQSMAAALSPGGRLVVYGMLSGQPCQLAAEDLVFRHIEAKGFWLAQWFRDPAHRAHAKAVSPALRQLNASTALTMQVEAVYDLGDIWDAIDHASRGNRHGKVLLQGIHAN